jgi:hypothetical protein
MNSGNSKWKQDLRAYYDFNIIRKGEVKDISGNLRHGTIDYSGSSWGRPGGASPSGSAGVFSDWYPPLWSYKRNQEKISPVLTFNGLDVKDIKGHIVIGSATGSLINLDKSKVDNFFGNIYYDSDNQTFGDFQLSVISNDKPQDTWGTSSNDTHFYSIHNAGKYGFGNTYHYDNRQIFTAIGDIETLSGSYKNGGSFITDYTGTGTLVNGDYTASRDMINQATLLSDTGLGYRPLGRTYTFLLSSSFAHNCKYLDEVYVYPPNHEFVVGSSKDALDSIYFTGTQNTGGEEFVSTLFTDLSTEAFYTFTTTGENTMEVNYG